jgi:hypothetical protein
MGGSIMSKRYSKVQEFYDLTRLHERFFNTDRDTAMNAYRAKMALFAKMNAVEREHAVKNAATVTHENVGADFKKLVVPERM